MYLPSGVALQRLVDVEPDQLDALSMRMHVDDHGPLPAVNATSNSPSPAMAATDKSAHPAVTADSTASNCRGSSLQCAPSDPRAASLDGSGADSITDPAADLRNLGGHTAPDTTLPAPAARRKEQQSPEVTSHNPCAQDAPVATQPESNSAHYAPSGHSREGASQDHGQQLPKDLRISLLTRCTCINSTFKSKLEEFAGLSRARKSCRNSNAVSVTAAPSEAKASSCAAKGKDNDATDATADALPSQNPSGICDSGHGAAARSPGHGNANSSEGVRGLTFVYRPTKPELHELVDRQFAIAALVATLQGQCVQSMSRIDPTRTPVFFVAADGASFPAGASWPAGVRGEAFEATAKSFALDVSDADAGYGRWHLAEGWRSQGCSSITARYAEDVFSELAPSIRQAFIQKMRMLGASSQDDKKSLQQPAPQSSHEPSQALQEDYESLEQHAPESSHEPSQALQEDSKSLQQHAHELSHEPSQALQAAKDKRAKKQAKANRRADSVQAETDMKATLRAESAAAQLLLEEQTRQEAALQKARKAAAKRAKAQQKKILIRQNRACDCTVGEHRRYACPRLYLPVHLYAQET